MELYKTKIRLGKNDNVLAEITDEIKAPINIASMGNRQYNIGEEVEGVFVDNTFCICRYYEIKKLRKKLFGYISKDDIESDVIKITQVNQKESKLNKNIKKCIGNKIKEGETFVINRELVKNY